MKEFFESRQVKGTIRLTLSNKKRWEKDKAELCDQIVSTIRQYTLQGYKLSLRQLYYQLVAADYIPNDDVVYKKLSGVLDDLRYSGAVDWNAIEDRGRVPYLPWWTDGVVEALDTIVNQYRLNRQDGQPKSIEVWTEKDAISGILRRVTSEFHVRLVVNKGYSSSSAMHEAYERFAAAINAGQKVKVLYFGDHDPSGLDMVRDIRERILFFLSRGNELEKDDAFYEEKVMPWWDDNGYDLFDLVNKGHAGEQLVRMYNSGEDSEDFDELFEAARVAMYLEENEVFSIEHIGLTREQIEQYNPPPNPAKITDPRAAWYIKMHGGVSWEVDALPPDVMTAIVRDKVEEHIDEYIYDEMLEKEKKHVASIKQFAAKYSEENGE